jgi:hypothetical protein
LGTVNGTVTSGSSIVVNGGTANGVVATGTVFEVAGTLAFNLATRLSTGKVQQFVVTAGITLTAGGAGTLVVQPEIIVSGNYQNMSATGVVNASAITIVSGGASSTVAQNWLIAKKAIALVSVDLPMVSAPKVSIKRGKNLSIRMIQMYDTNSDQEIYRMDVLYGWAMMRPEWCCRIAGAA